MSEYERNLVLEILPLKQKWINWKTFIDNINGGQIVFECFHSPWGRNVEVTIDLYDNWVVVTKNNKVVKEMTMVKIGDKYKVIGVKGSKITWEDESDTWSTGIIGGRKTFSIEKFNHGYDLCYDLFNKREPYITYEGEEHEDENPLIGTYSRLSDAKRGAERFVEKVIKLFK